MHFQEGGSRILISNRDMFVQGHGMVKHFAKTMMKGDDWNAHPFMESTRKRYGGIYSRLIGIRKDRKLLSIEINPEFRNVEIQFGLVERQLEQIRFPLWQLDKARKFLEDIVREWKN